MALTALKFKRNIAASTAAGYTTAPNKDAIVFANGDTNHLRSLWMGGDCYGVGELMTSTKLGLGKLFSDTIQTVAANSISATANRTYGVQSLDDGRLVVNVPWVNTTTVATTSTPGIYKIATSVPHGTSSDDYVPTQKAVDDALNNIQDHIPSIMVFKGTVGSASASATVTDLPSDPKAGDTYKVVTAGSYGPTGSKIAAEVGDMFVYSKPEGSTGSWILIPSGDDPDDTWRPVFVNGSQILGASTASGALGFAAGDGTKITYDTNSSTIYVGHSNSIAAGTLTAGSCTYTAGLKIGSIVTTGASFDAQGHITSKGTATDLYVPIATASALGVVKCGYTTSGKNYAVQVDSNGNLFVQVNWTDTHYASRTIINSNAGATANSGSAISSDDGDLMFNHVEGFSGSEVVTSYEQFRVDGAVKISAQGTADSLQTAGTITFGTYWDE